MNKLFVTILASILVVMASMVGYWLGGGFEKAPMSKHLNMEKTPSYWVAPMDPTYRRDQPGKSPMGMELLPVYDAVVGEVRISPVVEHNLGVRTQQVVRGPLAQHIETVGYIRLDEDQLSHIHTRVEGWIESLAVSSVGDAVTQGDVLFELYSPALVNAQEEYLLALRSNNTVLVGPSQQRLASLGLSKSFTASLRSTRKVSQRVAFLAPNDGILTSLNVREGMFVNPSHEVMGIGQLDSVWVIAEVFERQAGWLAVGQRVTMSVDSYPGDLWSGEVEYIYPELNEVTRTSQLRIRVDNKNWRLKPNMYAQLRIEAGNAESRLSVPISAVIRGADLEGVFKDRVVVRIAEGTYRTVPVKTGIESSGRIEILGGLEDSDTVVVSGQFLIDSESNIDAEIQRMSDSAND